MLTTPSLLMPFDRTINAAFFWNAVLLEAALIDSRKSPALQEQGGPTRTSRAAAIVHIAMHDAINLTQERYPLYTHRVPILPPPLPNPLPTSINAANLAFGPAAYGSVPSSANVAEAAAAGAAFRALSLLYPSLVSVTTPDPVVNPDAFDFTKERTTFEALKNPPSMPQEFRNRFNASFTLGMSVAEHFVIWRSNDGSENRDECYVPFEGAREREEAEEPEPICDPNKVVQPEGPGVWQSNTDLAPPDPPLGVRWGEVQPFTLGYSSQLRPSPPPPVTAHPLATGGDDYFFAFVNVYIKGSDIQPPPPPPAGIVLPSFTPEGRTDDERRAAVFWSYDDLLGTPIRLYNQHAWQLLHQEGGQTDLHRVAWMFALINISMADAGIACWEAKYFYRLWRPFQGILLHDAVNNPLLNEAGQPIDDDQNANTFRVQAWKPLGRPRGPERNLTPNFPAYVSGHSSFGTATFAMLERFLTRDFSFTLYSEELLDDDGMLMPRRFTRFRDASDENSLSRIYLGVHWQNDHSYGVSLGYQVVDNIVNQNFLGAFSL